MRYWTLTAATLALLLSGAANSATVIKEFNTAVAVNNLFVEGFDLPFNVTFCIGGWADCLTQDDIPLNNEEAVFPAADALNEALTLANVTSTGESGGLGENAGLYAIPMASLAGEVLWLGGIYGDAGDVGYWSSELSGNPFGGSAPNDLPLSWAKFAVVPVPAAAWLFGSALGLLAWVRRRSV